jgi:hypothetical protein
MIQFNLLPDIKIQYLRANRQKHTVLLISALVIAASLATLVVLLVVVYGLQKKNTSDLNSDIKTSSSELRSTPDLTKILTVQNQLKALPGLHESKPVASRLYSYLDQATPANAVNSRTLADFAANSMSISGTADSLSTVNVYIARLKATDYHLDGDSGGDKQAFTDVTLASFGRDAKTASYTITLNFDPAIFSEANDVSLVIAPEAKTSEGTGQ